MNINHFFRIFLGITSIFIIGCSTQYTTPASGVSIADIDDEDIKELFERKPASNFPARIAIARIQGSGYISKTNQGVGSGRFSVVTTRDIESDEDFENIKQLPMIKSISPMSRLLLPSNTNTIKDLRLPSAKLNADLLLLYSVETAFSVEGKPLGPLSLISLGFIPNKKAAVTSTISGAVIDVRTGFIYGTSEATAKEEQRATIWSTQDAIDGSRIKAERQAFKSFVESFQKLWKGITEEHIKKS